MYVYLQLAVDICADCESFLVFPLEVLIHLYLQINEHLLSRSEVLFQALKLRNNTKCLHYTGIGAIPRYHKKEKIAGLSIAYIYILFLYFIQSSVAAVARPARY